MIADLAKTWTDKQRFNISIINYEGQDKQFIRGCFDFIEKLFNDYFVFRFVAEGEIRVGEGDRSASYIGTDCLNSHLHEGRGPAIILKRSHINRRLWYVVAHEIIHFLGFKHPHEYEQLKEISESRYIETSGTPRQSILAYKSYAGQRNINLSLDDIKSGRLYPEIVELSKRYKEKDRARCECVFVED